MPVKKQQLEPDMEQQTGSKLGKEHVKAVYCHPAYAELDEAQAGIKIVGRNINNLRCADDTTLLAKREEELNSLLMKVKEESKKAGLKFNIQNTKIMASGPITSIWGNRWGNRWKQMEIDGETMKTMTDFIFLGSKSLQMVTAAMKLKDGLLLGRKARTNLTVY